MIVSLVNVKGGVGKTTTAVNLAATFAASELRATAYILPVVPHDLAHEALDRFFDGWERLGAAVRVRAELLGILLNMVDKRTNLTEAMVRQIRRAYGRRVFRCEIPINIRLAEAPAYGMSIFQYERWSTGAHAYQQLGAEVIRRTLQAGLV